MDTDTPGPIRRADAPDTVVVDGLVDEPQERARRDRPLAPILEAARPQGDHGTVHSGDGLFSASIPLEVLAAATLGADGRLAIADAPTKCWLVKDVRRIEVTAGPQPDSLPPEEQAKVRDL